MHWMYLSKPASILKIFVTSKQFQSFEPRRLSLYFIAHDPLVWVQAAIVSVAPDDGHGVVALLNHFCRMHILWHLVDLQNLPAINLVYAGSAPAFESKFVWIDCLLEPLIRIIWIWHNTYDLACLSIVWKGLILCCRLCDLDFLMYCLRQIRVQLHQLERLRKGEDKWRSRIAHARNFFQNGHLKWILNAVTLFNLVCEARAKYFAFGAALAAFIITHVLHQCQSWHLETIKKFNALDNIDIT